MLELILGGTSSGKSLYAEKQVELLAKHSDQQVFYLATASNDNTHDDEMQEKINKHQQRRPNSWQLIEESINLAETLQELDGENNIILVECLTLWLNNIMFKDKNIYTEQKSNLLKTLPTLQSHIIMVSNEVGMGIVPLGKETREFVIAAGTLNQELAAISNKVTLVVAGLPLHLKT